MFKLKLYRSLTESRNTKIVYYQKQLKRIKETNQINDNGNATDSYRIFNTKHFKNRSIRRNKTLEIEADEEA